MELDREALFTEHLVWAEQLARSVHRKLPPSFDLDDLKQVARIAHWKRCQLYDPVANDHYRGYAYLWIRGAVLMSIRRRNWKEATNEGLEERPQAFTQDPSWLLRQGTLTGATTRALREPRFDPERAILAAEVEMNAERIRAGRLREVRRLVRLLPAEEAYLVRRHYLQGAELDAIAESWGVPRTLLVRKLSLAVKTMKRAHDGGGVNPSTATRNRGWLFLGRLARPGRAVKCQLM
jgi:RNA polymerase sigma factor (sigma-70 family)